MNVKLFFFCLSLGSLIFSLICLYISPIINNINDQFDDWKIKNCDYINDQYDIMESKYVTKPLPLLILKNAKKHCQKSKALYGLEYSAFILDISFGFVVCLLAVIHNLEDRKSYEQYSGLIAVGGGGVSAIITLVYVIYSIDVFLKYPVIEDDFINNIASISTHYFNTSSSGLLPGFGNDLIKLYSNGALYKWSGSRYVPNYNEQDVVSDPYVIFINFKDFGSKQYNFNHKLYKAFHDDNLSEENNCTINKMISQTTRVQVDTNLYCDYIWDDNVSIKTNSDKKYLYNRWVTTIVFSFIIILANIGYAFFGFNLFSPLDCLSSPSIS